MDESVTQSQENPVPSGAAARGGDRAVPDGPLVTDPDNLPAGVASEDIADLYNLLREHGLTESTRTAYAVQWRRFVQWADARGATALPGEAITVATYLKERADEGASISTVNQARCAIGKAHEWAGEDDPTQARAVQKTVEALRRRDGTRPEKKKAATLEEIRKMVRSTPPQVGAAVPEPTVDRSAYAAHLRGVRNRAVLLVGFATACRRSEVAGMRVEHVMEVDGGLKILIPSSKGDQTGEGQVKGVPSGSRVETCPVRAFQRWMDRAGIEKGPIFRPVLNDGSVPVRAVTGQTIRNVVTAAARRAGLERPEAYTGHSLRSGWITEAARRGAPLALAQKHAGHKDSSQTAEYFQRVNLIDDTPDVGL